MGESHRRAVASRVPEGGTLLEWGSGATTLWFLENLPEECLVVSVEHDASWFRSVSVWCEKQVIEPLRSRHYYLGRFGKAGRNATFEEENPAFLSDYLLAPVSLGLRPDVILVDGVARTSCLLIAYSILAEGGTVFLHDAQRPWYTAGTGLFEEVDYLPSCPDYPTPTLWVGRKGVRMTRSEYHRLINAIKEGELTKQEWLSKVGLLRAERLLRVKYSDSKSDGLHVQVWFDDFGFPGGLGDKVLVIGNDDKVRFEG
jgi:hypothetical protein